ncbi:efflux RND transporter permease subunit [Lascolabacillus sp.]|jgi:CzcA family heavy metal efflux pump|uniref:efflux RND transporter permease subunit n=1 Tax=Lascolabacillus sp. TaxID=1924068 RepID=UPI0025892051|nr:efflux RND transporter permease subunit [Lascolabacillus sp.]MDD2607852.1 efflux RND transporter permease subunit [Lascolabacillus sp.]MDD4758791.1 efflux RND transporter permease subunit [Lascolabacillus sp.]
MLNKIIHFSLNNRLFILLAAILLIVGGLYISQDMEVDVFPDLTAPTVVVMTDAQGMSAEEVERLVTFHIETAMNGATDVRRVRSTSAQGSSFVWVEFDWGADIYKTRQVVSEKLVTLGDVLPEGVIPVLAPQSSIMGEILFIGMQSDSTSQMELRTLAEWVVKPAILATGGVSQVTIIGGDYKQYQILADPQLMNLYGVTMEELTKAGASMSSNSNGGVLRDYGNEYALRGIARTNSIDELKNTYIKTVNGSPILLSDVAELKIGSAVKMGHASMNGKPAVIISVSKQPHINTLEVTENIERNLEEIRKTFPADVKMDSEIFRQADFIEASVNNVGKALLEGALFVIIVLFLFLGSGRTTIISVVAIPLSLLGTIIVLHYLGMNINTMTLGGMAIAIGSLVDDAVIDVENVYKRLRQNYRLPETERKPVLDVVFNASVEIRASILNATFIIIASFVPLFFLSGMEGRMLKPLGIAYIVSLTMSLIIAMTVTPLMCRLLLTNEKYLEKKQKDNWLTRRLSSAYKRTLSIALNNKRKVLYPAFALFIIALGLFFTLGQSFLPEFNEGSLVITAVTKPGISLDENNKLGNLIESELLDIPEVTSTARRTGRGELDEHAQSANSAEIEVNFDLIDRSRKDFLADVRSRLANIPGVVTSVGQPLGHRIDHMLSGTQANIAIKIFGSDLSSLFMMGNQIKNSIQEIEGVVDVAVEQQTEVPQLQLRANRLMLAKYGITIDDFNRFINLAFPGEKLADIYEGERSFDLVIKLNDNYTTNIEQVKSALIDTGFGGKVPIEEVAEIVSVGGPNSISRENVQRKIVVSANVSSGYDLNGAVNMIRNRINSEITLPEGYRIEYGGQFENASKASRTLFITSTLAILVIFLLLFGEFKDLTLSGIILINLPLALIGGVFALLLTSGTVSIPSIIGFITLFGIATRNGILLVSRYEHMRQDGENLHDTVLKGSADRLNPILMTAITSALALIPLVFQGDKPGNEIQSPMAVVVLGGLITSTLLNIYIIPIVYEVIQKRRSRKINKLIVKKVK